MLLRLFQTSRRFNVEIQPQLVLLQKTLLNVEGLGRQLDPELDLWNTAKPFLERWMNEQVGWRGLVAQLKKRGAALRAAAARAAAPGPRRAATAAAGAATGAWKRCWPSSAAPTGCCTAVIVCGGRLRDRPRRRQLLTHLRLHCAGAALPTSGAATYTVGFS